VKPSRLITAAAVLLVVVALAGFAAHTRSSGATFTTSSQSDVTASVDTVSNWLHIYSESTDPAHATGYAHARAINGGVGPLAATLQDKAITVDLGDFPDKKTTGRFDRTFSIQTPTAFPDPAVTQITVTLSLLPDAASGEAVLTGQDLSPFGTTAGPVQSVTLGVNRRYQFNVDVLMRKRFVLGRTYYPSVVLSLTINGVANAFQYVIPVQVTDAGGT
jgi:hypothetical protein